MALTTSLTTLASKATPRNGFGGASAVWPALSSSRITPANPDASAKAPWTRTTVGPGMGSPRGWRGGHNDATSPDPSESAQGCAAPARNRLFCAAQPPCDHHLQAVPSRQGGRLRIGSSAWPATFDEIAKANAHADRRISMCKSNVRYPAMAGRLPMVELPGTKARSEDAVHGCGDRAVSAGQLECLVPGTRLVEQGSDDRDDVGAGDRATRDGWGREPDPAGGRSVGEGAGAQDGPVQVPGAQVGLGGGLCRDVGGPDLIGAGLRWTAGSHRGDLHESADPGPLGGAGH